MSNIDSLKIYDNLKASGVPEEQAHAHAVALSEVNKVSPEDLVQINEKLRADFSHVMDKLILKVDLNFKWLTTITTSTFLAILVNIIVMWVSSK